MIMKKYDLAVFDLDGTLLDTSEGVLAAVRYTIEKMGFAPLPEATLATFIGPPVQDSFARAYGLSGPILQTIANVFRTQYATVDLLKAKAYPGIYDLFERLADAGVKTAVATYKREDYALSLLRAFGFDRYTDLMHGADNENKLKRRDIIELCIKESGVADRARVVMVGDTAHDAKGAAEIGVDFIGVTFGFGFRTETDVDLYPNVGCADAPLDILRPIGVPHGGTT